MRLYRVDEGDWQPSIPVESFWVAEKKIVSRLTRRRIYAPTANGFFRFWNRFWIVFGALVHHGPDGIRVTDNNTRDDPRRLLFATADVLNDLPKRISNDRKRF